MDNRIVACARGWIGTRFHHQGRVKKTLTHKGGVDCLGLLVGVAAGLHLLHLSAADERDYPHYPDTQRLHAKLREFLIPVSIDHIAAGDIVLLKVDDSPQHLAIVSDQPDGFGIIHAYAPAKGVVEHPLDGWWRERIAAVFRMAAI
jgi:cell wall-associated NlpC family hydrolase